MARDRVWTKEEVEKLYRVYPTTADRDLEKEFPRFSAAHVKTKAHRLGIRKRMGRWTEQEEADLLVLWDGMESMPLLVNKFKRSAEAIIRKYYKLLAQQKGLDLLA